MPDTLQTNNGNDYELFSIIDQYLEKYEFEKAQELISLAVRKYPDNLNYRLKRANIIVSHDRYLKGKVYFGCDSWGPEFPQKGVYYSYLAEDYTKLLECCEDAKLYMGRAYAYEMLGRKLSKIQDLESAIELNPSLIECYVRLAESYNCVDDKKALYYYSQALDRSICNFNISSESIGKIYSARSHIYERLKDYESALEDLKSLKTMNNGYLEEYTCARFIKYAYLSKNYRDAILIIREKNVYDYFLIPYVYKKLGYKKSQIKYYKNILKHKSLLSNYTKEYLRMYKRLMVLQNKNFPHPILLSGYLLDKHILCYVYSIIDELKDIYWQFFGDDGLDEDDTIFDMEFS